MSYAYDVIAIGEVLIDLCSDGHSPQGTPRFTANPGGAPCNVLAMLAKLGHPTAFVGRVGADSFGQQIRGALSTAGISDAFLQTDPCVPTTLAIVHRRDDGDRYFSFYRDPGADTCLAQEELPSQEVLSHAKILHFGSLSLTHSSSRQATEIAVQRAKAASLLCSFDPNYRPALWSDPEAARQAISWGLDQADIIKIADDDLCFWAKTSDLQEAQKQLQAQQGNKLIFLTLGKEGSLLLFEGQELFCPAILNPNSQDATGAGDCFMGCMLHSLLQIGFEAFCRADHTEWQKSLYFATAAASLITTRPGALLSMPNGEEILAFLAEHEQTNKDLAAL